MITIYNKFSSKNQVLFSNGLAILDDICIKANIKEKTNIEHSFTGTFIIDKQYERHLLLVDDAIIKAPDVYGDEIFRIAKVTKKSNGKQIEIYARQITYDTNNLFLEDVRPTNLNGAAFLNWVFTHTTSTHEFTYASNIEKLATSYFINKNVHQALFTADNSFINRLGGESLRRAYQININTKIGQDNGVVIQSGKNLQGFEAYIDVDTVITRIYPKGKDGLTIDEKYIDSPYITNYPGIRSEEISFDIGVDQENGITESIAKQKLKDAVKDMYDQQQVDILRAEYKITFVPLEKTEEYKDYSILERVLQGDTVTVYEQQYGINIKVRVVERDFNVLKTRHESIVLSNIAERSISQINKIVKIINEIMNPNTGILQQAKDNATQLITNGLKNSYVMVRKNEILIMDTPDIQTAIKIWRWNVNGLGYSSTGYNGTFGLAMTMDGAIVADFITVGILNAGLIKAGVFESFNGLTWINMEDGTFDFGGKLTFDGTTLSLTGDYTTYDADTGNKAIEITKRIQSFKDWDSSNECGRIFSGKIIGQEEKKGVTLVARNGRYLTLSYEDESGLFQPAILIDAGAFGTNGEISFESLTNLNATTILEGFLSINNHSEPKYDNIWRMGQWGYSFAGVYSFAFNQASDRAKKYNINELESDYAYEVIKELKPYLYKYIPTEIPEDATDKEKEEIGKRLELNKKEFFAGVMADEVPIEMLNHDNEKSVNLYSYTTMLMGAMQEMMKKVENLENEVRRLGGNV